MGEIISFGQVLSDVFQYLATGMDMFGDYAVLIWALPPFWIIATSLIWQNFVNEEQTRDRISVAHAEQNLPKLRELPKQRFTEVLKFRPVDRAGR